MPPGPQHRRTATAALLTPPACHQASTAAKPPLHCTHGVCCIAVMLLDLTLTAHPRRSSTSAPTASRAGYGHGRSVPWLTQDRSVWYWQPVRPVCNGVPVFSFVFVRLIPVKSVENSRKMLKMQN